MSADAQLVAAITRPVGSTQPSVPAVVAAAPAAVLGTFSSLDVW